MEVKIQNVYETKFKGRLTLQNIDENILRPIKLINEAVKPCNKIFHGFIDILGCWVSVPADKLEIIKDIMLDLNTYSMIDDIADSTIMRGGLPASYKIFGVANCMNSYDFLLWGTLEKVWELNHPKAVGIYLKSLIGTYVGCSTEGYWRENYTCPTEMDFIQNAYFKTSSWMLVVGRLMQLFDNNHKDLERLMVAAGLYFQISDDYNCLTSQDHFDSKGMFYEDITEGKFSFPMVHAINNYPEVKETLIGILKQRTTDMKVKKQFLAILQKCGSLEYTAKKLQDLKQIMNEEVEKLGGNPLFEKYLECFWQTN